VAWGLGLSIVRAIVNGHRGEVFIARPSGQRTGHHRPFPAKAHSCTDPELREPKIT
jgi:signal transduction histidine kinase